MRIFFALFSIIFPIVSFASSLFEQVKVDVVNLKGEKKSEIRALKKQPNGAYRFMIPMSKLSSDIDFIDIIGDFAKAKKGEVAAGVMITVN